MLGEQKNIHGPIAVNQYDFLLHLTALSIITLKRGPSTAEPADPYSKAFNNCGRILCLQYCWGKESNDELRDVKNRFCSFCSLICQKENWSGKSKKMLSTVHVLRIAWILFNSNASGFHANDLHSCDCYLSCGEFRPKYDWNPGLCKVGAMLYQLSYEANWELVIMSVHDKPVDSGPDWLCISFSRIHYIIINIYFMLVSSVKTNNIKL